MALTWDASARQKDGEMIMIAILDYGIGNVTSVKKALQSLGAEATITSDPEQVAAADGLILPGVGAFGEAMDFLYNSGLNETVRSFLASGKPVLGICLGMQLLFERSEESQWTEGLGVIKGSVRRFEFYDAITHILPVKAPKVPHMGWNQVKIRRECKLLDTIPDDSYFYFAHSYYAVPDEADVEVGMTTYGFEISGETRCSQDLSSTSVALPAVNFPSAVCKGSVFGVQFHPEKSGSVGLSLLSNFIGLCKAPASIGLCKASISVKSPPSVSVHCAGSDFKKIHKGAPEDGYLEVIPAIDIRRRKCVRLFQGDFSKETVFSEDPVAIASFWASQGASRIHVVDLDGAAAGEPVNLPLIKEMASAVPGVKIELGGGLRTFESVAKAFEAGVSWAIVGTAALNSPELISHLVDQFDGKIIAAIDVRDGQVAVDGWQRDTGRTIEDVVRALKLLGIRQTIVTDIRRDGAMQGPNLDHAMAVARMGIDTIVSGGIANLAHVKQIALAARESEALPGRITGMIIGRALYTKDLTLQDVLAATQKIVGSASGDFHPSDGAATAAWGSIQ